MKDDENPAPPGCPVADIRLFFHKAESRLWPVVKITPKFYWYRCNAVYCQKIHRKGSTYAGYEPGAWEGRGPTPNQLFNMDELEAFAAKHGGVWDSGWRPVKRD